MAKPAEEKKIETIIANQNKLLDAQLAKEKQLAALQKERTGYMEREADAARKHAEEAKARLDMASEAMQISEEERKARLAIIDAKLKQAKIDAREEKISKTKLADIQKYHDQLTPILNASKEQLEILHKQAKVEEEKRELIKNQKEAAEGLAKAIQSAAGASTGISDAWKTGDDVGSQLAKAGVHGTKLTDVLGGIGKGFVDTLNPANLLGSTIKGIYDSSIELFTEMDKALATFRQQTGLSPEFEESLVDVRQEMVHLGAQTEDIADAFAKLSEENSAFVFQNKQVRDSLMKTTTAMKVAYDAEQEFAAAVGFSMTAMAESPKQAEKTAMGLAKFAKDIKASPKEMMGDYARLGPSLAAWGKNATKVFKETAAAAKALNIESEALLNIAGQFDTFDEAAGHVGQLNAMLGGDYFDTVEMVNASESERIEMLMEGVRATGKSWDSLGRFERKAIATAAGISDMAEANKMFGQGLDVYKELQGHVNDATMSYNDLSDAAIENMDIEAKQKALWRSLALSLEPIIDLANMFLGVTQKLAQATGRLFPIVAIAIGYTIKWAWSQKLLNAETIKGLALGAKNLILRGASATLQALEISRETRKLILGKASIKQRILGLAMAGKELIVRGALAGATWFQNTAIGAYIISTISATAAQWGLNAAMYANPVGIFVAAVVGLIAVLGSLIYYWDEVTAAVASYTDWLLNAHGAILFLMGPIGWLIWAGRTISDVWNSVSETMAGVTWESTKNSILDFVDSTVGYFTEAWQGAVLMWKDFWREMMAPINGFIGWFKKVWNKVSNVLKTAGRWMDSLLIAVGVLLGPAGWLVAGAALVYRHWEPISDLFSTIGDKISSIVDKMSSVRSFFSGAISSVGSFFSSLNPFSDGVANNKDGSDNFAGTSIINEGGMPEQIVTSPDAMNIVSNENLTRQIETNERVTQAVAGARKAERTSVFDPLESVFDTIGRSLGIGGGNQQPAAAMAGAGAGPQTQIIMEIDGTKIAKVLLDPYMERVLKPKVEVS